MRAKAREWAWYYLPAVLWLTAIFAFSGSSFSSEHTESALEGLLRSCCPVLLGRLSAAQMDFLNFCTRKLAHLTEYGILAALVWHAWTRGRREHYVRGLAAGLIAAAVVACADEAHQAWVANRTSASGDVLIDIAGAAAAVALLWYRHWSHERRRSKCLSNLVSRNS